MTASRSLHSTALVFLLFQALYAVTSSGNVFRTPDEFEVYFQTESVVDRGDLSVPQTLDIVQPVVENGRIVGQKSLFFGKVGLDRRPYAPYGPLAAILALPHHLLGRAIAAAAGVSRGRLPVDIVWLVVVGGFTMLATSTAAALAVAGFHRAARRFGAAPGDAVVLAILLGTGTVLWPYGTSFFSEAFQAAALVWAIGLLMDAGLKPCATADHAGLRPCATAAALIALAILTKVTALVFAPAFVAGALAARDEPLRSRVKTAAVLSIGIGVALGIHAGWNAYRFGNALDFGYDWSETVPALPARPFSLADMPRGLIVLLFTPGKSIVLWAPPVILGLIGMRRFWQQHRGAAVTIVTATVTGLLFFAAYLFPEGGYSHGPRNLVPIIPLLMLPAVSVDVRGRFRTVALACGAAGFAIALLATAVSYLDDQGIGADLGSGARGNYYERIAPPPGRAFNRYRLAYIPFASALSTPNWLQSPVLGQGPDYFSNHLRQARRQLPNGGTIPGWLIWMPPLLWLTVLGGCARRLYRC